VPLVDAHGMQKLNNLLRHAGGMLKEEPMVRITSGQLGYMRHREAKWDDMNV